MFKYDFVKIEDLDTVIVPGKSGRFYSTPTGKIYPSITTVLSEYSKESIMQWRKRVGDEEANRISAFSSSRGTKVHAICEAYIKGENIELSNHPDDVVKMFESLKPILDRKLDTVLAQETTLWSDYLRVAGRVDLVGTWRFDNGSVSRAIIDIKTSMKPKKEEWITGYFRQATAYACMYEEVCGMPISNIVIAIAVDNSEPQIFERKRASYLEDTVKMIEEYHKKYGTG